VTRDRLDLLGEEYFRYKLKPHLKPEGVRQLRQLLQSGADVTLVSQGLDHLMRPLARDLGVRWIVANRMEFRDGVATGRLLDPVIRPRGWFARITGGAPNGQRTAEKLERDLDLDSSTLGAAAISAERPQPVLERPVVHFDGKRQAAGFSVRRALAGKHVLLIGVTGFIGKVWLANLLLDLPEIGRIYLLIRRQKSNPALQRFDKMVEDSPVFDPLF